MTTDEVGVRLRVKDQARFNAAMKEAAASVEGVGTAADRTNAKQRKSGAQAILASKGFNVVNKAARTGALGLVGVGAASFKFAADFDQSMANVRAVSGATGTQFNDLRNLALEQGAATKFSASQAADAMYELASGGTRVDQMASTLKGTLSLAAASGVELADAAEIQVAALGGFNLDGSKATHVADVLAQSVADSALKMTDLQYSMKYIGPIAVTTGQSFETMVGALEIMAQGGIKGEQAGTTLRGGLVRLVKPTKMVNEGLHTLGLKASDLQGPNGLKPLPVILEMMRKRTEGMSKAQSNAAIAQIFGTEALSGFQKLLNAQPGALDKATKGLEHSDGASAKMAKTMNKTLKGGMEQVKGSAETLGIKLFDIVKPTVTKFLVALTATLNLMGQHATATAIVLASLAGAIILFYTIKGVLKLWVAWEKLALLMQKRAVGTRIALMALSVQEKATAAATWILNAAMSANPIALVIIALVALGVAFVIAYKKIGWFRDAVNAVWSWIKSNWPYILGVLTGPVGLAVVFIIRHWDQVKGATSALGSFIKGVFNSIIGFITGMPGRIGGAAKGMFNGIKTAFKSAINWIIDKWNGLKFHIGGQKVFGVKTPGVTIGTPNIPHLAAGGIVRMPGAAMIGENGPEILNLDRGARVDPLPNARRLRAGTIRKGEEALGDFEMPAMGLPPIHLYIDGKEVAVVVKRHADDASARR